ncbi:AraC family transcriptional regulator [Streptomyces sp. NPDC002133]|uniref:AraC family transcriptional regulator n=1 Tax=Streptomyces sp. NPDC002133 TaxID=3154409 RepID=UPI00332AC556
MLRCCAWTTACWPSWSWSSTAPRLTSCRILWAGLTSAGMTHELVDAVTRQVRLLDTPEDIHALAGRIEAEILYRLLRTPAGGVVRLLALRD